jgi:hypothetical protein
MKTLLCLLLWLVFAVLDLFGQGLTLRDLSFAGKVATPVAGGGGASYDWVEGFEAAGYDKTGWSVDGTINNDNTTNVLAGSQSCAVYRASSTTYLYRTIAGTSIHVAWVWKGVTEINYSDLFCLAAVNYYDQNVRILTGGANTLRMTIGSQIDSDIPITWGTTYYCWLDYEQDTSCDFYISTTGTKPGSPSASATAAETPNTTITRIAFQSQNSGAQIYDQIITNATAIGNFP